MSTDVYDLETGELCNLTVPTILPSGWHAVMDRRCGPTGQLLYYNEETEELTAQPPGESASSSSTAPPHWRPASKNPLAVEFERKGGVSHGDKMGFLASKRTLLEQMESVERLQLARRNQARWQDDDDDNAGSLQGWNGFNAVVRAVKRAAMYPLTQRQKVQTAHATRVEMERYTASQSLWQTVYCCACLLCLAAIVFVVGSVRVASR